MTPIELSIYSNEYYLNEKEKSKEIIIQAYYIEAFARMKKLPKIEDLFKDDIKPKKHVNSKDMLNKVKKLNAMFGGEIIGGS